MSWLDNLLRRSRLRGLVEGPVQRARVETHDADAKDNAERWQDYGFSAHPVDGQGLVLNVMGHTIVLRMDRLGERPELQGYEVAVWHKEGHMVKLKAGRVVEVTCDKYVVNTKEYSVNASTSASFNTPVVNASKDIVAVSSVKGQAVSATSSLKVANKEVAGHNHGNVQNGGGSTSNF